MAMDAVVAVLEHSKSKHDQRLVLMAIASFVKKDGTNGWPGIIAIAEKANISERSVQNSVKSLVAIGELQIREEPSEKGTNVYDLIFGPYAKNKIKGADSAGVQILRGADSSKRGADFTEMGADFSQKSAESAPYTVKNQSEPVKNQSDILQPAHEEESATLFPEPPKVIQAPPPKRAQFKIPTQEEVAADFKPKLMKRFSWDEARAGPVAEDWAEDLINFYAKKGWMVGKNPMVDWKSAVNNWIKTAIKQGDHLATNGRNQSQPRTGFSAKPPSEFEQRARGSGTSEVLQHTQAVRALRRIPNQGNSTD